MDSNMSDSAYVALTGRRKPKPPPAPPPKRLPEQKVTIDLCDSLEAVSGHKPLLPFKTVRVDSGEPDGSTWIIETAEGEYVCSCRSEQWAEVIYDLLVRKDQG